MTKFIKVLLVLVLIVVGIVGWSYLNKPTEIVIQQPTETAQLQPTEAPLSVPTESETSPIVYANPSVVIDAIETTVQNKQWADLLPFMVNKVTLIKYATSCCGLISKNQAISELTYLNDATGPWNFSDTNPIALSLESNDPEHFKEMWIGTATSYEAVGFKWNDDFLIEKISIVNDYRTITGY